MLNQFQKFLQFDLRRVLSQPNINFSYIPEKYSDEIYNWIYYLVTSENLTLAERISILDFVSNEKILFIWLARVRLAQTCLLQRSYQSIENFSTLSTNEIIREIYDTGIIIKNDIFKGMIQILKHEPPRCRDVKSFNI